MMEVQQSGIKIHTTHMGKPMIKKNLAKTKLDQVIIEVPAGNQSVKNVGQSSALILTSAVAPIIRNLMQYTM